MSKALQERLAETEREAKRLAALLGALLGAYPDVEEVAGVGLVSPSVSVIECDAVSIRPQSGEYGIRFGRNFDGHVVWSPAVHAETLLLDLMGDEQGGAALARLFAERHGGIYRVSKQSLETHWAITCQGPRATKPTTVRWVEPGADALRVFFHACNTGRPGAYALRGNAARQTIEMATAKVQATEMAITWRPEWVLFVLGAKGLREEVEPVVEYLREFGAMPKEHEI